MLSFRFFLYLKIILLSSCIVDGLRWDDHGRGFCVEDLIQRHKHLFFNASSTHIMPHTTNVKLDEGPNTIKDILGYFLHDKANILCKIEDLLYSTLPEVDCAITPFSKFSDFKEQREQDAVLNYIVTIVTLLGHVYLTGSNACPRYMDNPKLIHSNAIAVRGFKKVDEIAFKAKKKFKERDKKDKTYKALDDVIHQALCDIFAFKKIAMHDLVKGYSAFPPDYISKYQKQDSDTLVSLERINKVRKIVYEQCKSPEAKAAMIGALYIYRERFTAFGIQHRITELIDTKVVNDSRILAGLYTEIVRVFENTQEDYVKVFNEVSQPYEDLIHKGIRPGVDILKEIEKVYIDLLKQNQEVYIVMKEALEKKITHHLSSASEKEACASIIKALEGMYPNATSMEDVDVVRAIQERDSDVFGAIHQVFSAHLLERDLAGAAIDKAFKAVEKAKMPDLDLGWETSKRKEKRHPKSKNDPKYQSSKVSIKPQSDRRNNKKNQISVENDAKTSTVDATKKTSLSTLAQNSQGLLEAEAVLEFVDHLAKRCLKDNYKLHHRVSRWSNATVDKIKEFDGGLYAGRSEEAIMLQQMFHDLPGVYLLLFTNDYANYFFKTSKGMSAFGTMIIGDRSYDGILEIGISPDKCIYHLMFNHNVQYKLEHVVRMIKPALEYPSEDSKGNNELAGQFCNKYGFEIAKKGDAYVITLNMPTDINRASHEPCKRLYIHPNKLSMQCVSNN